MLRLVSPLRMATEQWLRPIARPHRAPAPRMRVASACIRRQHRVCCAKDLRSVTLTGSAQETLLGYFRVRTGPGSDEFSRASLWPSKGALSAHIQLSEKSACKSIKDWRGFLASARKRSSPKQAMAGALQATPLQGEA